MKRMKLILRTILALTVLLSSQIQHAGASAGAGTIFFTVDYSIQADVPDNEACSADGYTLNIVMEGVGVPNQLGELEGVTIVADLHVDLGPGAWWITQPQASQVYSAAVKLHRIPTSPTEPLVYPLLVTPVPPTSGFTGTRACIRPDGTVEVGTADLDPAQFINNFHGIVITSGGMKEVEPGEYLSRFHLFVNDDGVRRLDQRVWWGDRRAPGLAVEPDVEGVFLSGVPADVEVTYDPRWADDANTDGDVWVKLGPGQWIKRRQAAPQTFVEKIPLATTLPTQDPIEGWVQLDVNHRTSERQRQPFTVAPKQTLVAPDEIGATKHKVAKAITYKLERNMPPVPFQKQWIVPAWFPAPLKGKDTTIKAQLKLADEYNSTAAPTTHVTKLGFEGELEVGQYGGKLGIDGTANVEYSAAGLNFLSGQGKAELQVGIKETVGPFDLVPALKPVVSAVKLDGWLEQYAKVEAGIFIFGGGDVQIEKAADGLTWQAVVTPGLRPIVKFQIGEDDGSVRLELEAKGEGRLTFHLNMPGDLFQGAEGELTFTGALTVLHCKWSKEVKYTLSGAAAMASALDETAGSIGSCGEDVSAASPAPERWLGGAALPLHSTQARSTAPISVTLVAEAFDAAAPALDATGSSLCWVSRRGQAPAGRNTEIVCAGGDAPQFGQPLAVTTDTYADAAPRVALAAPGQPVVAWWRHDDPNRPQTVSLDAEFLGHGEVMASAYDPAIGAWSTPVALGTPQVLDYAPVVAGNAVDGALVAWRTNAAAELYGFGTTPDSVQVARYDPATRTWGAAEPLLATRGLLDLAAAYGAGEAALLYAIDMDGVAATTGDTEIHVQRLAGGVWQPVQRLTDNAVADTDPRIAYRADGTPVLVWLQTDAAGNRSIAYQEGWTGPEGHSATLTPVDGENAPGRLANLAVNGAGDALLLWRNLYDAGNGSAQSDLTYAVRQAATGAWSAPLRLTRDAAHEHVLSLLWRADDTLAAVYQHTTLDGVHAVQYLEQTLGAADASVDAADIVLDPANPAPGAPLTATVTVRNLGSAAQQDVTVTFVERDAWTNLTKREIDAQTIPLLRGGAAHTLRVPYVSGQGANTLAVTLACAGGCGDSANDGTAIAVNQPNLVLTNADVVNGAVGPLVRAAVVNSGVVSATLVAMTVTAGLPAGETVLGSTFLQMHAERGVLPGERVFGEFMLPTEGVVSGTLPLTVTVAPAFGQRELTGHDNSKQFLWTRLPDLSLDPNFVDLVHSGDQTTVSLTVFNHGPLETPATSVVAYTRRPDEGGEEIGSAPVPALAPYAQTSVELTLAGSLQDVWLRVNARGDFAERTLADNDVAPTPPDAVDTPSSHRVLLPMISR